MSYTSQSQTQPLYNGRRRLFTALLCICVTCLMAFSDQSNVNTTQPKELKPADMVQNAVYFFADHGNGMSVAKYDRMEGDNIYTFADIKPLQLLFSGPGLWGTVEQAGAIRLATLTETIQLLLSILAGVFVPYP